MIKTPFTFDFYAPNLYDKLKYMYILSYVSAQLERMRQKRFKYEWGKLTIERKHFRDNEDNEQSRQTFVK